MKSLFLVILLAAVSCGNNSTEQDFKTAPMAEMASADQRSSVASPSVERKIIKTGDFTFETKDINRTKVAVEKISKELNGYIANESQNNFDDRIQYHQTVRVPAEKFDTLLVQLELLATRVDTKNINTQDVTEEFIDVEARLKTKKELELRYLDLLKQAKNVSDIVSIEGQLATVRSEIESMEGRLTYLKNQVAFSTLHVSYYEIVGKDFGFGSKVGRAVYQGWDNLLSFLILMVNLWPFLLLFAGFLIGLRYWRKRKAS